MRSMSTRFRLLLALLLAAIVGGVAAGVVLARGDGQSGLVSGHPAVLARGTFHAVTWGTSGTATILRDEAGNLRLRFSSGFQTQRAPELYVYLVGTQAGSAERQEVGSLKRAWGRQEYNLPTDVARHMPASVAVFCAKCNKDFGVAPLQSTRGV
jgi:electron transfer DM13